MLLLLTILSVLALWSLLAVLGIGLLLIYKALQSIRAHLEKIAMGVRAIERETAPLGPWAAEFAASLAALGPAVRSAAGRVAELDRDLDAAAPALRLRG